MLLPITLPLKLIEKTVKFSDSMFVFLIIISVPVVAVLAVPMTIVYAIEFVFTNYLHYILLILAIFATLCIIGYTIQKREQNDIKQKENLEKLNTNKQNRNSNKHKQNNRDKECEDRNEYTNSSKIIHAYDSGEDEDPLLQDAISIVVGSGQASTSMLQRRLKLGYARAARVMDQMEERGIIGSSDGSKPRRVLISKDDWLEIQLRCGDELFCDEFVPETGMLTGCKNRPELDDIGERIKLYNNKFDYMDGHDFEYFCADLLRKNGFDKVEVTKGSGDQGIDIIAFKDGIKYGIQCKCYANDIGNSAVQEAFSGRAFYRCHVAAVLTNRYFTSSAKELAENNGVLLWDRDRLNQLCEVLEH